MNEKLIQQALHDLADQAVPADLDPCRVVRTRIELASGSQGQCIGKAMRPFRLNLAGTAAILVVLGAILFFLTPPGQVFARDVIRFFTLAGSDVLPLPTGQATELPPPTRTAAPTQISTLQSVTPAVEALAAQSYPTATPVPPPSTEAPLWNLTLEEAEALAGFALCVPASLPPGYRLDNITFDPQTGEYTQFYGFHPYAAGEQFILHQRPSQPTDLIGQSAAVEQMVIGGVDVEYVSGSWNNDSGANTESWQPGSIFHTFRWLEGDFYFTLEILFDESDTWSPAYWMRDGMLAMLEIILGVRSEYPEQINPNYLTSVAQAEKLSGLDLLAPSLLPQGFVFSRAVYDPQTGQMRLFYQPEDGSRGSSGVNLVILEKQAGGESTPSWDGYPPDAVEAVMVGGNQATFVRGTIADGVYDPESTRYLLWNTPGLSITLIYSASPTFPTRLEKEDLLAIAESMQ